MSIAALVANLTQKLPDVQCVPESNAGGYGWLDVSNENLALTIEYRVDGRYDLYLDSPVAGPAGPDFICYDMAQAVRTIVPLFEQAEKDKLLMVAYVNGRPVFLPHKANFSSLVKAIPFGNPERHRYVVSFIDDADGNNGYVQPGGFVRLGKHTIISVVLEGVR